MSNQNRHIWNNGFTNDRSIHNNKTPFKKKCSKCKKEIWLTPAQTGWKALETDGSEHKCNTVKNNRTKAKGYNKACNRCGQNIRMQLSSGKWNVQNLNGDRHRCKKREGWDGSYES